MISSIFLAFVLDQEEGGNTGGVGTRNYMAPEVREKRRYSYPIDVYALGVILLELFSIFRTWHQRVLVILDFQGLQTFPDDELPTSLQDNYPGKEQKRALSI
jgi:serine/threonine protein kinase